MGIFTNKWAGEILLETKRIHGLAHDASETEVHEHLRGVQSYDDLVAQVQAANPALDPEAATARETELQATIDQLQSGLAETTRQHEALAASVTELEATNATLTADLATASTRITELEKEPAAPISNGPKEPAAPVKAGGTVWEKFKTQHNIV